MCLALIGMVVVAGVTGSGQAEARPSTQAPIVSWSEPHIVWETSGTTSSPTLVTDAWGSVHLFFLSQQEGEDRRTLYHADADNPDTVPVDILIDVSEYRVAADPYGRLHVLALGAVNVMVYTSVEATDAGKAVSWSPATTLGTATLGVDISADSGGGLHLCYPLEHAVGYQRSNDGGANWSDQLYVADTVDPSGVATYVRCVMDNTGTLHMAWAEARPPNYYPPDGVFYARSADRGETWDTPEVVAGQHYTLPTLLADPSGLVHMFWQGDVAVGGRFYRQRAAGNEGSWGPTETVVPTGQGGMSGVSFMALDSQRNLHVGINIDGIYWSSRTSTWTAPLELSGSVRDLPNALNSIEQAALAIANGNEIYVAFEFDFKRIYLMTGQSDAPAALATPMPAPISSPKAVAHMVDRPPTQGSAATPSSPPTDLAVEARAAGEAADQDLMPVVLGTLLAMMIVGSGLWIRKRAPRS